MAAAFAIVSFAGAGHAGDKEDCAAAYDQTQTLRDKGKLIEARTQARVCSASTCAAFIVKDCIRWLSEIEASLPTVVFAAQDASGADTSSVRMSVDGQLTAEALDGKAVALDPGPHKLRFETAGADPIEQAVVVRQGEKDRRIAVSFQKKEDVAAPPAPVRPRPPASSGGVPIWAWVASSLGLAFAGATIGFGVDGLNAVSSLKKGCASSNPNVCTPMPPGSYLPDADNARKDRDLALTIGFGAVGVAGIGAAIAGIAKSNSSKPPASGVLLLPIVGANIRGAVVSGSW